MRRSSVDADERESSEGAKDTGKDSRESRGGGSKIVVSPSNSNGSVSTIRTRAMKKAEKKRRRSEERED